MGFHTMSMYCVCICNIRKMETSFFLNSPSLTANVGEHVRTCTKKMFNGFDEREGTIALVVSLKIPFTKSYDMNMISLPQI